MQELDWPDIFAAVISRGEDALDWGLPEAWVHAELFAELRARSAATGWIPFASEVPYCSHAPVTLPSKRRRELDAKKRGEGAGPPAAVKYADLCLRGEDPPRWLWFEFKVRAIAEDTPQKIRDDSFNAFRKDTAALAAFDPAATADIWCTDDIDYKAYWYEKVLGPHVDHARRGRHGFVSAYLQLGAAHQPDWSAAKLAEGVGSWLDWRARSNGYRRTLPPPMRVSQVKGGGSSRPHTLVLAEW